MRIVCTDAALGDLEEILAYQYAESGPRTAQAVERRSVEQIGGLPQYPERIRKSERIPGARELVINRLPYIAIVKLLPEAIVVLNVIHTARKFPA